MKVKPLKSHLLVKNVEKQETTKSGILLTGSAKEEANTVEVVAVPDLYKDDEYIFKKGDKLVIPPGSGTAVKLENEEYKIISLEDICAILCE